MALEGCSAEARRVHDRGWPDHAIVLETYAILTLAFQSALLACFRVASISLSASRGALRCLPLHMFVAILLPAIMDPRFIHR